MPSARKHQKSHFGKKKTDEFKRVFARGKQRVPDNEREESMQRKKQQKKCEEVGICFEFR